MRKILIGLLLLLSVVSAAQAQDESRQLKSGQPVSGVIDTHHLTQMYSFMSKLPFANGLTLQNSGALPLKIVIIDSAGMPQTTVDDIEPGAEGRLTSWLPPNDGTYYVVIYPTQALNDRQGSFTLTLDDVPLMVATTVKPTAEALEAPSIVATENATAQATAIVATATPETVVVSTGLQFELDWRAGARLSLEVRDPLGQDIHWKNIQTPDSGSFVGDTDPIDCTTFTPHPLMQAARWQAAVSGSYEILVHYIDGCANSVPFTLNVKLNNQTYPALSATAQANQTFVGGFVVNADGSAGLNSQNGMVNATPTLAIQTAQLVSAALALPSSGDVTDQIDADHAYHSYQFQGRLGDTVSAVVKRTSGSLDTMIALLDTNGNLLAINDDSAADTTDSALSAVRLRHNGTYLIVVTRYAQMIGATEGGFELTVTGVKS